MDINGVITTHRSEEEAKKKGSVLLIDELELTEAQKEELREKGSITLSPDDKISILAQRRDELVSKVKDNAKRGCKLCAGTGIVKKFRSTDDRKGQYVICSCVKM
jgi:hypothetical protein